MLAEKMGIVVHGTSTTNRKTWLSDEDIPNWVKSSKIPQVRLPTAQTRSHDQCSLSQTLDHNANRRSLHVSKIITHTIPFCDSLFTSPNPLSFFSPSSLSSPVSPLTSPSSIPCPIRPMPPSTESTRLPSEPSSDIHSSNVPSLIPQAFLFPSPMADTKANNSGLTTTKTEPFIPIPTFTLMSKSSSMSLNDGPNRRLVEERMFEKEESVTDHVAISTPSSNSFLQMFVLVEAFILYCILVYCDTFNTCCPFNFLDIIFFFLLLPMALFVYPTFDIGRHFPSLMSHLYATPAVRLIIPSSCDPLS